MEINYFDLIASVVILLLGLKGILNGFFKEAFGLIGIIGGLFVASRVGERVGEYLNNTVFHFANTSAINFTGFLVTLAAFWLVMIAVGVAFKKLSSMSGLGLIDRVLGFIFAAGKFFLIAAVIAFAVYNVKSFRTAIDTSMKNSILFPILVKTGGYIMKIDPTKMSEKVNSTIDEGTKKVQEGIQQSIEQNVAQHMDKVKEALQEATHKTVEEEHEETAKHEDALEESSEHEETQADTEVNEQEVEEK